METKDIQYFKVILTDLLKEMNQRNEGVISLISEYDHSSSDVLDRASTELDHNYVLRIKDRERKLVGKIRLALERIEDGTYGICDTCGEDIAIGRLKARPVAEQCIDCKTKEEIYERASGM